MYTFEKHTGKDVAKFTTLIANYRISFFKKFPYLYEGNMEYESNYLEGILNEKKSLLVVIQFNNSPIGISTSYPLTTEADILTETYEKFISENKKPEEYFYYSEIILSDDHRQKGLSKTVYEIQEDYAKTLGFKKICLATVLREKNDIRKPLDYRDSDGLWENLGFSKTKIIIDYEWPTIQFDSSIQKNKNKMIFWEKNV